MVSWVSEYAGVKFAPFSSLLYTPNPKPQNPKTPNPKALTRKGCKFDFCLGVCLPGCFTLTCGTGELIIFEFIIYTHPEI